MVTKDSEANPAAATVAIRRTVFRMELFLPNGRQFKRVIIRRLGANAEFCTGVVARGRFTTFMQNWVERRVRAGGLEPPRPKGQWHLKPSRKPIPPRPQRPKGSAVPLNGAHYTA